MRSDCELTSNARSYATSEDLQNPLSGYTFVDPNELLVGSVNRKDYHHVQFETFNDVQAKKLPSWPVSIISKRTPTTLI